MQVFALVPSIKVTLLDYAGTSLKVFVYKNDFTGTLQLLALGVLFKSYFTGLCKYQLWCPDSIKPSLQFSCYFADFNASEGSFYQLFV
jgi:hypothetical protein